MVEQGACEAPGVETILTSGPGQCGCQVASRQNLDRLKAKPLGHDLELRCQLICYVERVVTVLDPRRIDPKHPAGPVRLEINSGYKVIVKQERIDVVAMDALRPGYIDFDSIAE